MLDAQTLLDVIVKRHGADDDSDHVPACETSNDYDGRMNLRILSVFILLISSGIGVNFPILASQYSFIRLPKWCFFIAKFFGSGVIIATAFVHLLEPAADALGNACLGGTFAEYPWAFGICLMSLFFLFFTEIISHHIIDQRLAKEHGHGHDEEHAAIERVDTIECCEENSCDEEPNPMVIQEENSATTYIDSKNKDEKKAADVQINEHLQYDSQEKTVDLENSISHHDGMTRAEREQYLNQLVAVMVLEAGVIVHSVFIGLSLAVTGDNFVTLFIVLTFHQMFEGLGLGTRVAETPWPKSKRMTPWLMALAFTLTTPVAVAIGLGVRNSWVPGSRTSLIANGIFDAISAGILIYTGLVELMAHEFLYSGQFKGENGLKQMLSAYFVMCCGAALMALLGKWA
ncbi:hypothetical protein TBLA_0H01270 [Henningerozyma blattae CBS 6284]|uniref:Zinc/iron permease n=1 Tax=Henningerozyma blattae (strain ATCC 34711 / CBS 6284 / DSM 70876 / NBRC 10599 / NRRL Y-10934 / UCD 77-7) TaxID=1071380 RepID=I2H7R2_HENB6|nr:hypothetical protein TBLA_0H01270 [Tetrapisispora blattae CBS 6284]CCH62414.1 hypothetical protein TBLA_0H01270 [Tetrapisispora blattae CBS 6284]